MAKKSNKNQETKAKKGSGKNKELSFGGKIKRFFVNLKNELKLVVWPDRKEVKQTTAVVLIVVAATVLLVFVVDSIMTGVLNLAGFNTAPAPPAPVVPTVTTEASTEDTTAAVEVTEPSDAAATTKAE